MSRMNGKKTHTYTNNTHRAKEKIGRNPYVVILLLKNIISICITVVMLGYDWWLCMVINISVAVGFSPTLYC